MTKTISSCVLLLVVSAFSVCSGQYGFNYGGAPVVGVGYPLVGQGYNFGYGYVSAGFGNRHNPHQPAQFGIAKVQAEQSPLGYQYSVQESGPFHHKHVHQSATTNHHVIAQPVAVPAAFVNQHYGGFGQGQVFPVSAGPVAAVGAGYPGVAQPYFGHGRGYALNGLGGVGIGPAVY